MPLSVLQTRGMKVGISRTIVALAALGFVMGAAPGYAKPSPIEPGKAHALAGQIEAQLLGEGCGATSAADVAAIQGAIATSGADPFVARAALREVRAWRGLCGSAAMAVASVDLTVLEALEGSDVPHSGGPGGGLPIGSPSAYVSGGGSDYKDK